MGCGCQKTFKDYIIGSPESIKVNAILEPSTTYVWELTDGFGNVYHQEFTTDEDGFGSIDMSEMPEGFANPSQAPFSIKVKTTIEDCSYIPLVVAQRFLEMLVDFRGGSGIKDWVACPVVPPTPYEHVTYDDVYSSSYL